jgi:hypothetical protein
MECVLEFSGTSPLTSGGVQEATLRIIETKLLASLIDQDNAPVAQVTRTEYAKKQVLGSAVHCADRDGWLR